LRHLLACGRCDKPLPWILLHKIDRPLFILFVFILSMPPLVAAFSRKFEVERRDGCIVKRRSHESRLTISLAGVCEVVQALVVDEAEGRAEPACAK
jgi:hypothetical protein